MTNSGSLRYHRPLVSKKEEPELKMRKMQPCRIRFLTTLCNGGRNVVEVAEVATAVDFAALE